MSKSILIKKQLALSLLELMVVLAIIGIIALWAIPSFQQHLLISHRAEAKSALLSLQLKQEKWRASHTGYANLEQLQINTMTENGYYQLSIKQQPDSDQFLALARPLGSQKNDNCGIFAINQFGAVYQSYASISCWGE